MQFLCSLNRMKLFLYRPYPYGVRTEEYAFALLFINGIYYRTTYQRLILPDLNFSYF